MYFRRSQTEERPIKTCELGSFNGGLAESDRDPPFTDGAKHTGAFFHPLKIKRAQGLRSAQVITSNLGASSHNPQTTWPQGLLQVSWVSDL